MEETQSTTTEDDVSEAPSLDIALDEIRRKYDEEEERRTSIESKASIVIGINALITSLVTIFLSDALLIGVLLSAPVIVSTIFNLRVLQVHEYHRPGKEVKDFYQYVEND